MGRRDLKNEDREAIVREIFLVGNGAYPSRLPYGFSTLLGAKYGCHESTIRRLHDIAKKQGAANGNMKVSVTNRKKGRVGRQRAHTPEQVKAKFLALPLIHRSSLRSISAKTKISRGSLQRYLKAGMFRAHSSVVRPLLTDANKYGRLKFALSYVGETMEFDSMMDVIHLDEKWYYLTKTTRKFYLVPGEKEPDRKCKSKRYITKVMFLSASPVQDTSTTLEFGGTARSARGLLSTPSLPYAQA
ncbi:Aste57867_11996 [Aphanomyces stellatus]|uniref:Aste57867_11996 protein n=1 Tax=Aphanomyces stellatus TaxID=120398 RepID=A0A485KUX0_9STRA|nr:hypothetical protein As57867_011951 [Aphanomyces stellatus]VFT88851.1 Aste57867_11996 [Aphanomyces stellatus]